MRNFFIDLENVRSYGLEGVLLLRPDDMVYVFYSDNANTLTIPTIESLNESPATVKYIKTNYIGANAMDFQIVTLLGATIERDKCGSFFIISHDNGFKSAVRFCEGYFQNYDIVTGVYANIILALNSENSSEKGQNSAKADKKNGKTSASVNAKPANSVSEDNERSLKNEAGDIEKNEFKSDKGKRHKKKKVNAASGEVKENEKSESVQESENGNISGEKTADDSASFYEKEEGTGKRKRRRRKKNHSQNTDSESALTSSEDDLPFGDEASEESSEKASKTDKAFKNNTYSGKDGKAKKNAAYPENKEKSEDAENAENSDSDIKDEAGKETDKSEKRSRRNRRNRRRHDATSGEDMQVNQTADKSEDEVKNSRNAEGDKVNGENDAKKAVIKKAPENAAKQSEDKSIKNSHKVYGYIYSLLSDYLSESTIAMYASSLDEGIRGSKNKDEFHNYLKSRYDSGEAEALYKIVSYDFDDLKKKTQSR